MENERRHAANHKAWALGHQRRNGFQVRRIVWGLMMARSELREHEEIRAATICVGPTRKRKRR